MQGALIAIGAAGLAGWLFGAVWYMALGKPWQRAHGMNWMTAKTGRCR